MNKNKPDLKQIKQRIQQSSQAPKDKPEYKIPERPVILDEAAIRPQQVVPHGLNRWIAFAVFAVSLIVYMLTQARSLSFWDAGEYSTCISILGVPHPPGNPFYILFGKALVSIFGGFIPHAMIAAFLSGLFSAFAVMFTYLITVQLASMFRIKAWEAVFAGAMAAFFTAFSFTFWMNAIEAEVYGGLVFFVNIIIWLTLYWVQRAREYHHQNILLLIVYLFFLGFCVHQTALQIAPAVLFIVVYPLFLKGVRRDTFWLKVIGYTAALIVTYLIFGLIGRGMQIDDFDKWGFALMAFVLIIIELHDIIDPRVWFLGLALVVIGLSAHLYLMVRAADRPFINEGHPSTLEMFQNYVLRKQYGQTSMFDRRVETGGSLNWIPYQFGFHFLRYFTMQWFNAETLAPILKVKENLITGLGTIFIAILGLYGAIFHSRKNKHSFFYFLAIFICSSLLMVFVMNLSDKEVRERDYFFVVAYNMWAIWMGIGALGILHMFRQTAARYVMVAVLAVFPLLNLASQYYVHDRSREFIALDYGVNFLNSLEENAIIFTNGDNDTFPIWYAQAVRDPYATAHMHAARDVFPTQESTASIAKAMEFKDKELKGIRKDVSVANLSLLNTPWYIRQLRDREGVLFSWSDEEIENLQPMPLGTTIPFKAGDPRGEMTFSIEYEESPSFRPNERYYRMSDLAVIQIIKDNFGKRPIYFAVTCESYIGFDDYLRNEGMVGRLVHTRDPEAQQLDIQRLLTNINQVYQYRSIHDPKVYKDENMRRLTMNYGSGYVRAATWYSKQKDYKTALEYEKKAKQYIDSPIRMTDFYVRYYSGTRQWDKLDEFIRKYIFSHVDGDRIYVTYVLRYFLDNDPDKALDYLRMGILQYNDQQDLADLAVGYAQEFDRFPQTLAMLDSLQSAVTYSLGEHLNYLRGGGKQK
jgi:hypothetical protein